MGLRCDIGMTAGSWVRCFGAFRVISAELGMSPCFGPFVAHRPSLSVSRSHGLMVVAFGQCSALGALLITPRPSFLPLLVFVGLLVPRCGFGVSCRGGWLWASVGAGSLGVDVSGAAHRPSVSPTLGVMCMLGAVVSLPS
jgi:hypothetical protein